MLSLIFQNMSALLNKITIKCCKYKKIGDKKSAIFFRFGFVSKYSKFFFNNMG